MSGKRLYFEDFHPGQEMELGSHTVSEQEIVEFARQFDPQPFHVDHEAAGKSPFGGVIASGWHTCSIMMRIVVDSVLGNSSGMGSPGLDRVCWIVPVRPGDTLSVRYVTTQAKVSASRPERGMVWSTWEARNQDGVLVCIIEGVGMFGLRPKEDYSA